MKHTVMLTNYEFRRLPEYSLTVPTGVTIGRRWRRCDGDRWLLGEYVLDANDRAAIRWRWIELMDPAEERRAYGPIAPTRRRPARIAKRLASRGNRLRFPARGLRS
ncbi:MAG TPA: hypothetical protein VM869_19410 [Enhygromyxa sp.]|jgi:hypothetical protein|nr:hypothetical protein [Enhygromyxa sp.]